MLASTRQVDSEQVRTVFARISEKLDRYDESLIDCLEMLVPEYQAEILNQKSA